MLKTTWTYRYKIDAVTNQISRFRSRWCARGDLEDASGIATFSATAAIAIVRQMISLYEVKDCLGAARKSKSRKRARHHRHDGEVARHLRLALQEADDEKTNRDGAADELVNRKSLFRRQSAHAREDGWSCERPL